MFANHLERSFSLNFSPPLIYKDPAFLQTVYAWIPVITIEWAFKSWFFKNQLVTVHIFFIKGLGDFITPVYLLENGSQDHGRSCELYDGFATRDVARLGNLIICIMGKSARSLFFTSCSKTAITRYKHPVIWITHDTHKERSHTIVVAYFVIFSERNQQALLLLRFFFF
jgi:hypothetical protein